ncbi:MAG: DoxX family protein [Pseudorhizobium sp.]
MTNTIAILVARLIFGGAFLMATTFKFAGMEGTAQYIASIGFPVPLFFAWVAAFFELGLALALFTGAFFCEAASLATAYVLFLALAFHGPDRWEENPTEFGFFVDHFTFIAGLLFAALHGPGDKLALGWRIDWKKKCPRAGSTKTARVHHS